TRMVKASPALRKRITVFRDNLHIANTASKYEPLSSDYNSLDGLNIHGAIVDELHAHKSRDLWDVLETSTGSRRQPLFLAITTAGYNRQTICWEQHEYTQKILDGVIQDDSFFGIIYTLDGWESQASDEEGDGATPQRDDWEDETVWIKANPGLDVIKKRDAMRRLAKKAGEMPAALNNFLRRELNVWTQAETRWVPLGHWQACGQAVDAAGLRGRIAYGGLDLSSNTDLSAWGLVFPPETDGDPYRYLVRFFIPEENILDRVKRDRVPYDAWVRQGYITATPGNVIDYDWILAQVDEDMQAYDVREIAFDRWGAAQIQTKLLELGGPDFLVQFGQGYASMSPAMKELEKVIVGHTLAHGNNPVLNWMAHNLVAVQDAAGNLKPDKANSLEKIDGMVTLLMALDRATRHEPPKRSVYEDRGLVVV
ncbi:MAG TPA: terminase large subunit, partial [Candidatus Brocadiia bacterium]|nr:terminase large subunit [Candidatus Brocadiia bacterium]